MINTIIENKFKPETLKGHLEKWFEDGIITQEDWKCLQNQKRNEVFLKIQLESLKGFKENKYSNFYNFFYNEEIQDYVKEIYRLFELKV